MPQRVGVRELKNDTSQIIRAVREDQTEYIVTYHGEPVAVILPLAASRLAAAATPSNELRAALADLRAQIAARWDAEQSAVELLEQQRR
jgi:prevent-host-death family protein